MGKPRVTWTKSMEYFILDLWGEKFNELQASRKNGHIYNEMVEALYQKFGIMEITKWDLQVKIHNLSRKYREERKQLLASGNEVSNWKYYERIHNLYIKYHKEIKDINSFNRNNLNYGKTIKQQNHFHTVEFEDAITIDDISSTSASPQPKIESPHLSPEVILQSPERIKYINWNMLEKLDPMKDSYQIDSNSFQENSYRNTEIENYEKPFDQFGKYVASELRQLPQHEAILLQQELQNSIIRVKLSCIDPSQLNNSHNKKVQNNISSPSTSSSCLNTRSTTLNDDSNDLNLQNLNG